MGDRGLPIMSGTKTPDSTGRPSGGRRLTAVLHADVVGYSRLIGLDDVGTLDRLGTLRRTLIDPAIAEHGGRLANTAGDSLLIVFDSVDGAVRCAVKVQQEVPAQDGDQPPDRTIRFRVGINVGDVIPDGLDVHGDVVNVAARLQAECPAGGVCVSRAVRDHVQDRLNLVFEELGALKLKNINRPVEAFVCGDAAGHTSSPVKPARDDSKTSRLSMVVLPFDNLSRDPEQDYLAEGLTEDLTTDLSQLPGAFVIARNSAFTYKGEAVDVKQVGSELGVRYVIEGSVRKLGEILRLNVRLTSAESGVQLWAHRFDAHWNDLSEGQDEIVSRIASALNVRLIDIEGARSARERPNNPDALDLVLRARSLQNQTRNRQRTVEAIGLYERALELDSSSIPVMMGLVGSLLSRSSNLGEEVSGDTLDRTTELISIAAAVDPSHPLVLTAKGRLLMNLGRWLDAIPVLERLVEIYPSHATEYADLAFCKIRTGHASDAIPLLDKSLRRDPRGPLVYNVYGSMGFALLLLGDDKASITWNERCLIANPEASDYQRAWRYSQLACAHARSGNVRAGHLALAEANRLAPHDTVRSHYPEVLDPAYKVQVEGFREGLRAAGLRDHAEEDADFGLASDQELRLDLRGYTPTKAPGARTIRTADLRDLLARCEPVVVDIASHSWGESIPGAIGLEKSGRGGSFLDMTQDRLRRKMGELTKDDPSSPIVIVGWNCEHFGGWNLTLRVAALGYTNLYWYRGGREAWEVNGLPETDLELQDW